MGWCNAVASAFKLAGVLLHIQATDHLPHASCAICYLAGPWRCWACYTKPLNAVGRAAGDLVSGIPSSSVRSSSRRICQAAAISSSGNSGGNESVPIVDPIVLPPPPEGSQYSPRPSYSGGGNGGKSSGE